MKKVIKWILVVVVIFFLVKVSMIAIYGSDTFIYLENEIQSPNQEHNVVLLVDNEIIFQNTFYSDSLQLDIIATRLWFGNHSVTCVVDEEEYNYELTLLLNSYLTVVLNDSSVIFDHAYFKPLKM